MGITLTAFVDGTAMSATDAMARFGTIRDWQNGQILGADIVAATVPTRAIRRIEHYVYPVGRSKGVTGSTTRETVTSDPSKRTYVTRDSHGPATWCDVSTMFSKFLAEDSGTIEVVYEWWCWTTQSNFTNPEQVNSATFRILVNGVAVADSEITLLDAGTDATVNDGGPFCYPARNMQAIAQRTVSAGWVTVKLQVRTIAQAAWNNYGLTMIGAKNKHVEYWRK